MSHRGQIKGGVVVLEAHDTLPEGTVVSIIPLSVPSNAPAADPLLRMSELAVETGIEDLASNIDHYLNAAALTADRHFNQAGFRSLLKNS